MSHAFVQFVVAVLVGFSPSLDPQTEPAAIAGVIRDASGAAIPGATVRIVNEVNDKTAEAVSDAEGTYRATGLAPGRYRLEIALDGFEAVARQTALAADQTA